MAQYTLEASKCDWECLSKALQNRCDIGKRRIPWCRPASLLCDGTGDCSMQCDDTEKTHMISIEIEGLKTFLQQENVLCEKGDIFEISMSCDECDIQVKTMRFKLPRSRRRLPCETIQEMLEQNEVQFECIYKICDCQTDNNSFISHCKVANIGKGQLELSDPNADDNRDTNKNKNEKTKEKKGKSRSSPRPTDGDEGQQQVGETTTSRISTTSRKGEKGKGQNSGEVTNKNKPVNRETTTSRTNKKGKGKNPGGQSGENEPASGESSTTSTNKKGNGKTPGGQNGENESSSGESSTSPTNKKGKGKNPGRQSGENEPASDESSTSRPKKKYKKKGKGKGTASRESTTTSVGDNNIEQTSGSNDQERKPRKKGFSNNPQCLENIDDSDKTRETTLGGETSTNDDVSIIESTQSLFSTISTTDWEGSTLTINGVPDTTEEERGTTEVTSHNITENEKKYTRISGVGQTGFIDTTENGNRDGENGSTKTLNFRTDSVNGSTSTDTIGSTSNGMTAFVTKQPEPVTLPRSGSAFHDTTMFNYALAGGVAGLVLILLVILCLVLFTRDRKKKRRYLEESMNLPPPIDVPDDESLAVYNRKSSKRLSAIHDRNDQRRSFKLKSFSLKKIEPPDTNHI
ncbi:protein qua-1-like [Mizuhopecten yessoensis]|uniref:protein qua-1-like n=1 Tax=Mizuhopecten yessoensis TaxID=6573 RepID=UPI000B45C5D2|nr:protein qua-1-like [Mizuhopecten yessoensis]